METNMIFYYSYEDHKIDVKIISRDQIECPFCNKILKNILHHLRKGTCKMPNLSHFAQAFQNFKAVKFMDQLKENHRQRQKRYDANLRNIDNKTVKEWQNQRKAKSIANQRAINEEKVKKDQNTRKTRSIANQRAIDEEKVKKDQTTRKAKSIANQRAMDEEKVKKNQNIRRKLSRNKRKLEEPAKLSELEGLAQRKKKNKWSEKDRLREFRHDTKYSCIFICNCCHRRLFHENVEVITEKSY